MSATAITVLDLIETTAQKLSDAGVSFGHGTTNAFDEAAWLVLWQLGFPLDDLDGVSAEAVSADDEIKVRALIDKRISTRKPAAYLTQEAWLQGVPFYIDERAIVPRSFIAELLADGSIDPWLDPDTKRVLDLCTGNGSLAVLCAMAFPDVEVDASDISAEALEVAKINIDRHELTARIRLVQGDGFGGLDKSKPYDLIVCNPPYVNSTSMSALPAEYSAEPSLALAGGDDGMDFIRGLISDAPDYLTEEGVLVIEIGNERAFYEAAFPHLETVWLNTTAGDDQVLLLTRESLVAAQPLPKDQ